jgi:hypothetical protein
MATYDVTPVNGGANAVGTLEKTAQINGFLISLDSASDGTDDAPVDLRAVDAAHGSLYDLVLRELQPVMAFAANANTGVIHAIMDGHGVDATSIAARLAGLDGIGIDTAVALGTAITVS